MISPQSRRSRAVTALLRFPQARLVQLSICLASERIRRRSRRGRRYPVTRTEGVRKPVTNGYSTIGGHQSTPCEFTRRAVQARVKRLIDRRDRI